MNVSCCNLVCQNSLKGEIMDIRCRKRLCKFNDKFTCKANQININSKIICDNFVKDPNKKVADTTKHLLEEPPCYAPQRDSKTLKITCQAKCLFNHNGQCVSNGITLNSIKEKPYCVSFLGK